MILINALLEVTTCDVRCPMIHFQPLSCRLLLCPPGFPCIFQAFRCSFSAFPSVFQHLPSVCQTSSSVLQAFSSTFQASHCLSSVALCFPSYVASRGPGGSTFFFI